MLGHLGERWHGSGAGETSPGQGEDGETQLWEVSNLPGPKSEVSFRCVWGGQGLRAQGTELSGLGLGHAFLKGQRCTIWLPGVGVGVTRVLGDWSTPSPSPWLVGHNGVSEHLDTHQKGHSALPRVKGCSRLSYSRKEKKKKEEGVGRRLAGCCGHH